MKQIQDSKHKIKMIQHQLQVHQVLNLLLQEQVHNQQQWQHQLKMECLDSLLPSDHEIVPLTTPIISSATSGLLCHNDVLRNSRDSRDYDSISISCGNVQITIGPSVSEEKLLALLKAVRHA